MLRRLANLLTAFALSASLAACGGMVAGNGRGNVPLSQDTQLKLASMGSSPADPMMIRIFKESSELEVWKRTKTGAYKLFQTYEICTWSGGLGPKVKEGDRQAPEGFYTITPGLLNPNSNYYLAFNTGFPNKFDRAWGRTGSNLMVHGDCSSSGCYAMTNDQIKEIYALARETFKGGNASFHVEIYPFRMTPKNLARHASSGHMPFWKNLKDGYDRFELTKRPSNWDVCNKEYVFDVPREMILDARAACPAEAIVRTAALDQKQAADEKAMQAELATLQAKAGTDAEPAGNASKEQTAAVAPGQPVEDVATGPGSVDPARAAEVGATAVGAPVPAARDPRG